MGTDKCIHWNTKLNGAMFSGGSFTGVLGSGTFSSLDNPLVKMRVTALLDSKSCGTFAPIPSGTYSIGNTIGDSDINDAKPVSVTLSDYYMSVNDTTKDQWNAVTLWGGTAGYTDLVAGRPPNPYNQPCLPIALQRSTDLWSYRSPTCNSR